MKNPTKTPTKKSHWLRNSIIASVVLLIGLVGGWIYLENTKVYPLGDTNKLEYIGKVNYGCWWVCDANPVSTYYYATNMDIKEVALYFKRSTVSESPRTIDRVVDFTLQTENGASIWINYYIDKNSMSEIGVMKKTNKKAVLSIPSFEYDTARAAI